MITFSEFQELWDYVHNLENNLNSRIDYAQVPSIFFVLTIVFSSVVILCTIFNLGFLFYFYRKAD